MNNHKLKIFKNVILFLSITFLSIEFITPQNLFLDEISTEEEPIQIDISKLANEEILSSGKNCTISNCPPGQGICVEDMCLCAYGYTSHNLTQNHPQIYCNYRQKSRLMAFFLEFFFPIGIGHAYAGKTYLAFFKFSLVIILICGTCGELCCIGLDLQKGMICSAISVLFVLLLWIGLSFFDLFAYAFGYYSDGNGVQMI